MVRKELTWKQHEKHKFNFLECIKKLYDSGVENE